MNFFSVQYDIDFSLNFEFDHTGYSAYSLADKEKIVNDSFKNIMKNKAIKFCPGEIPDQKLQHCPVDSFSLDVHENNIQDFVPKIKRALIYNLYVFGTFKWGQYIVFDKFSLKNEQYPDGQVGFLFVDTERIGFTSGVLQSAYSDDIVSFAGKFQNKLENNLYKVVKNHGYHLKNDKQKCYMFGKAHIALQGKDKILLRQDLNVLFKFMNDSKEAVKREGVFKKIPLPVDSFKFFEFEKN